MQESKIFKSLNHLFGFFLVFIGASLYFVNANCAHEESANDFPCRLFMHKSELGKPRSEMEIGTVIDVPGVVKELIPADDPARTDDALFLALNGYAVYRYKDEAARQRVQALAAKGAPISTKYEIWSVGHLTFRAGFLMASRRRPSQEKSILDYFSSNTDSAKDVLCAVAQGHDARYNAFDRAVSALVSDFSIDLIGLIISFSGNSLKELKQVQDRREQIRRERHNQSSRFKFAAALETWWFQNTNS